MPLLPVFGHTAQVTFDNSGLAQVQALGTGGTVGFSAARFSNDANPTRWCLGKSRGASVGTFAAVTNGDVLGEINFEGSNATDFATGAFIRGFIDGTVASPGMPGALMFATTPAGSDSSTARWTINSSGHLRPFADATYDIGGTPH